MLICNPTLDVVRMKEVQIPTIKSIGQKKLAEAYNFSVL